MIYSNNTTLPEYNPSDRKMRYKNKIVVSTKITDDGHYTERLYIDYDPKDQRTLDLLLEVIKSSVLVECIAVYGADGKYIKNYEIK